VPAFGGPLLSVAQTLQNKAVLTFVGFWLIINVITGLYSVAPGELSGIAWEAHIGGFVAGFFGIALLLRGRT
jgi:membrane associated rhomboid family serine protease